MYKNKRICVVVPAFNEEEHIIKVICTIPSFVDQIVVVDDASSDNTYKLSLNCNPKVISIRHNKNQGVGGAIISGHKKAIELGYDISVVMAGDAQMDPKYLTKLINPLVEEGYHYTKGNRFMRKDSLKGMPRLRIIGNIILTFLNKLSSGYYNISDPQNGYTAIRLNIFEELDINQLAKRYEFENSMLLHLNIGNFRVKDVSIPSLYGNEKSKIRLNRFIFGTSIFLFNGFLYRLYQKYTIRNFHPIIMFLLFGSLLFTIGFYNYFRHILNELNGIFLILGIQFLLTGIILDASENPR